MPFVATNPLSQRVAVLERLWQEFRRFPDARLCRWLFAPGEAWFLDYFLQEQAGPEAVTNDIFIILRTPAQHWQTYLEQLYVELASLITHDVALLAERDRVIAWSAEARKSEVDPLSRLVGYLNRFVQALRSHTDGDLVLCLLPSAFDSQTAFDQVLSALLTANLSSEVRLVVVDTIGAEQLATLVGRFGNAVRTSSVDLQLQKITRQLASLGSPTAPDVKFRQWNAELAAAINQRSLRDVIYFANNCLLICEQEQWYVLGGSVHLSVAHAYATHRRYEESIERYNRVVDQMEPLFSRGDESAGRLSIMAWLGLGAIYAELRQRQRAIDCNLLASERAEQLREWLLAIEANRRLALAHAQESRSRLSELHYLQLFTLAEQLPPEQHQTARLAEIGQLFWQQQTTTERRQKASDRLVQLLGEGWRKGV